jgi:hypothetical protein
MKILHWPCFRHINWRPDRDELRRFAVTMLIGFFLIGLVVAWRRHSLGPPTFLLWIVGAALALSTVLPRFARAGYLAVYLVSSAIGYCVSHAILVTLFFFLFTPFGVAMRLFGRDHLRLRREASRSLWLPHRDAADAAGYYRRF